MLTASDADGAGSVSVRSPSVDRRGTRHKDIAKHRCTDVFCLIVFLAFNAVLASMAVHGWSHGDMHRLSRGFDFMGRLCASNQTAPTKVQHVNGDFVYWCSVQSAPDEVEVHWSKPICVDHCPDGSETVFCPDGPPNTVLSERDTWGGGVVLETLSSQTFTTKPTVPTRRISNFCFPATFGPHALANLERQSSGSWADILLQGAAIIWQLQDTPCLVGLLMLVSFAAGLLWICALQYCSVLIVHFTFLLVVAFTFILGLVLAAGETVADSAVGINASLSSTLSAASEVGTTRPVTHWAVRIVKLASLFGIPYANVILGAVMMLAGVGLFFWYCKVRRSINLTAASMREGCKILFLHPTLIVILPLLELTATAVVVLAGAVGLALTASTMEVRSQTVPALGEAVVGLYRSFAWTPNILLCILTWVFGMLWYMELVGAMRSYILSYTAAKYYFSKDACSRGVWLPITSATRTGVYYHLGSLIFGALCLAILRATQIALSVLYSLLPEKKDRQSRVVKWVVGSLDLLVTMMREVLQRVSDHAYTEVLLTSDHFCAATQNAADIMLRNASLIWFRTVILRPMMLLGTVLMSMGLGFAMWLALSSIPPEIGKVFPPMSTLFEEALAVNTGVVATVGAIMSLAVVRTFSGLVNLTSDAILYCFLWDKEDGVVDAKHIPKCFLDYCQ